MDTLMGIKELYDMKLKALTSFQIGDRKIQAGEVIAAFDDIQLANFQEIKKIVSAHGGFNDWTYVTWESTKEIDLVFTQGIFSRSHLALLSNSDLITKQTEPIKISEREEIEFNQFPIILKHKDNNPTNIFIYNKKTGQKCLAEDLKKLEGQYTDLIIDYEWDYTDGGDLIEVGNRLINGFMSLEARTKTKDDITGKVKTAILKMPKVKIVSSLSMQLGENATPMVSTFKAIGYPVGSKGYGKVMDMYFLNSEIDSDM